MPHTLLMMIHPVSDIYKIDTLRQAQKRLSEKPVLKIIEAIDQVAARFLNPEDSFRREALSLLTSEMSEAIAQFILDDLFGQLTRRILWQLLEEELGDPLILDEFRPRKNAGGFTRAYGSERITHILPGNVLGIAVMSLVFALLVKSASMAKISTKSVRSDAHSSLAHLFWHALRQVDSSLADAIVLIPSGEDEQTSLDFALDWADLVLLYGSNATVEAVRARILPKTKTIIHGPRVSLGIISAEQVSPSLANAAARDIVLYDQRGCLSPHLYYVETQNGAAKDVPLTFAKWVAEALENIPKPRAAPDMASAIQQLRGVIPLKGGLVFASPKGVDWTVLYDPDPAFTLSPGFRTLFIKPIADFGLLPALLNPIRSSLQAVGLAVSPASIPPLLHTLGTLGASRVCPIGKMQEPPVSWHHDGRFRILDLLRFVDWEPGVVDFAHESLP